MKNLQYLSGMFVVIFLTLAVILTNNQDSPTLFSNVFAALFIVAVPALVGEDLYDLRRLLSFKKFMVAFITTFLFFIFGWELISQWVLNSPANEVLHWSRYHNSDTVSTNIYATGTFILGFLSEPLLLWLFSRRSNS